jgi:glycosyltransferase involved in cell wall biosynthesis
MDISVILSTFRRPHLLQATLENFCALSCQSLQWELIVVDNGDDIESREVALRHAARLPISLLTENKRGKNNALNTAIEKARGELFVFTDDDVLPKQDWLIQMWQGASRWPTHSVFGGRILPAYPPGRRPQFDHPFFIGAFAIANWEIPEGEYEAHRVWGPNMAIRAELFKDGWRFNPEIGPDGTANYVSGSETELTNRLEAAGFKAVYLPLSLVYHQIREDQLTDRYFFRRAFRLGQQIAFKDYGPRQQLLFGIPRTIWLRFFRTWKRRWCSGFTLDERNRFDRKIEYWQTLGAINWYRSHRSSE